MARSVQSLIPGGTIQFLDLEFRLGKAGRSRIEFCETVSPSVDQAVAKVSLDCFIRDEESDQLLDLVTGAEVDLDSRYGNLERQTYTISNDKCLEPYFDKWVPIPIFRLAGMPSANQQRFRVGPTDWVRCRLSRPQPGTTSSSTHQLSLAFDTYVEDGDPYNSNSYSGLTYEDVRDGGEFSLASDHIALMNFISMPWVKDWLLDVDDQMRKLRAGGRRLQAPDFQTEYLARYVSFIELLKNVGEIPVFKLVDPARYKPIEVDLVLDVGNSRSIGMLIEKPNGEDLSLTNGSTLEIRDLSTSQPVTYRNTFSSYVSYSKAMFGDEHGYSRGSARVRPSFSWPTVVRVGTEAQRIASNSKVDQGQSAMSSPKRYLWDLKPRPIGDEWRFCGAGEANTSEGTPVNSGSFVANINDQGMPIHQIGRKFDSALLTSSPAGTKYPVTQPRFSRSSNMMFLISEILAHALVQINSPKHREERGNVETPRKLSKIIITVPPAMSISERKLFVFWAGAAVDVLWGSMGWNEHALVNNEYRQKAKVSIDLDEASATQVVFVYNEIAKKFNGKADLYFNSYGKLRANVSKQKSLRIASIDIGGGTTDMVVTTYINESHSVNNVIVPTQDFRESFHVAGDDLLKAVIEKHVLPEFFRILDEDGLQSSRIEIQRRLNRNALGLSQKDRNTRARFTQQILHAIGLDILRMARKISVEDLEGTIIELPLSDVLAKTDATNDVLSFIDIHYPSGVSKSFWDRSLRIDFGSVGITLLSVISKYLDDLAEIVHKLDCDFLILSGWPSSLPVLRSVFQKNPPVSPARLISMSEYKIENWYPFVTPDGRIDDPKTTGVVGAMLVAISEGNLLNFHFRTDDLKPASTIRYIGPMENNKQIMNSDLFFGGIDLTKNTDEQLLHSFNFETPTYIGFRQFRAERWKTTPYYFLKFSDQAAVARSLTHGRPYQVELSFTREMHEDENDPSEREGVLRIEEIRAADGTSISRHDLELQLRTLWETEGHWLDTGLFDV